MRRAEEKQRRPPMVGWAGALLGTEVSRARGYLPLIAVRRTLPDWRYTNLAEVDLLAELVGNE